MKVNRTDATPDPTSTQPDKHYVVVAAGQNGVQPHAILATACLDWWTPIVEDSHKDTYWGAVAVKDDPQLLRGANVLGRLLVALRDVVDTFDPDTWQVVSPAGDPRLHPLRRAHRHRDGLHLNRTTRDTTSKDASNLAHSMCCARRATRHCR